MPALFVITFGQVGRSTNGCEMWGRDFHATIYHMVARLCDMRVDQRDTNVAPILCCRTHGMAMIVMMKW